MELFAIAGGAPPSGEAFCCCSLYIVLASVVVLSVLSAKHESYWGALVALALAGGPLGLALVGIADYEPSSDWEVVDEQAMGRRAALWYTGTVSIAILTLLYMAGRQSGWIPASRNSEPSPTPVDRSTTAPIPEERIIRTPIREDRLASESTSEDRVRLPTQE